MTVKRREFLAGASALGLGLSTQLVEARAADAALPDSNDIAANVRALARMQMSAESEDVLWWYVGRIYAQVGNSTPELAVNFEGTEIYYPRHLADGSISVSSRTLTFFRDKDSGAMLRSFENPWTGKTVAVTPNVLGGPDGGLYTTEGLTIHHLGSTSPPIPWRIEWSQSGDLVWLISSRGLEQLPQPWLETMTMFGRAEDFFDPKVPSVAAHFSSTYLSPWLGWMDMGDRPGHLVWHASGRKLRSVEEVPAEYRARVEAEHPGKLTAHPDSFDRT